MKIGAARADELPAIIQLLNAAGLPTSDLTPASLTQFLSLRVGDDLCGAIGLDMVGDSALLRSLVVAPARRRNGMGSALVRAAEATAARQGVKRLFLLTNTAERFFVSQAYALADRAQAPEVIRCMPQFAGLCPSNAAMLTKAL